VVSAADVAAGALWSSTDVADDEIVKFCVLIQTKLDSYQLKQTEGADLNQDQKDAVAKYEVVLQNLEFARDLHRQFQLMLLEVTQTDEMMFSRLQLLTHSVIHWW